MIPRQLSHRPIRNSALAFDSYRSPINPHPVYVAGSNVLTSFKTYLEKRPPFIPFETTPTTFAQPITRAFSWHRWDGTFFTMLNTVGGGQSIVYKLKAGTDASFISLFTSSTATAFDFIVSNNQIFFSNGTDSQKWDGTTLSKWGITSPAAAPTVSPTGTGSFSAVTGYTYVYCYYNSNTGHVSSPSPISATTGAFSGKASVALTLTTSGDTQVNQMRVFRSTDGGGGIFFEVSGSPFNQATSFNDSTADTALSTQSAPVASTNDPNPGIQGLVWYANRIWGFSGNKVYFTAWEENILGIEEESFNTTATGNFFAFDNAVKAINAQSDLILVFTSDTIHKIEGDSLDTFRRSYLSRTMGAVSITNVAPYAKLACWLNSDKTLQITDGFSIREVGTSIRKAIQTIDPTKSYVTFYNYNIYHFLLLMDGGGGAVYAFDLDTQQWMPSWALGGSLGVQMMSQGETSNGVWTLFLATSANRLMQMDTSLAPANYKDDGNTYAGSATTNLFDLVPGSAEIYTGDFQLGSPPGHWGEPEYISVTSDATQPSTVSILTDEDPFSGTFSATNVQAAVNAPFRVQGTNLIEKWYYVRQPGARRVALKFDWNAANTTFKLYEFDVAYPKQGEAIGE